MPYIFEIQRGERARNSTGRAPAARDPRGIIGLRLALSQLSHRRKRTARLIIPKPFLYHTDPPPSSFTVRGRCARLERERREEGEEEELERRNTKRRRNEGEGEGGPPFIPKRSCPFAAIQRTWAVDSLCAKFSGISILC